MKVLLINPKVPNTFWSLKTALKFVSKKALMPPLGLLTVASMLPPSWEKKVVDMNTTRLRDRDLRWADAVYVTAMVVQKTSVDAVIARCNKMGKTIVAGGPLFTAFPEIYPTVDHLVLKEAELTLPKFLADLEAGQAKPFYNTHDRPDMSTTPVPMWDMINMKKYALMCVQYSRGCPFDCDFCDVTKLFGHTLRTKTTAQVLAELDSLYDHGWRGEVFFVDDNFIGKKAVLKADLLPALTDWMEEKKYPFRFNTQASINLADDPALMELMVQAGFDCVFIGIESPNEESLAECNKAQNTGRDLSACIRTIIQSGLQVQGGFILGFDSDHVSVFDSLIQLIQSSGIVVAMVGLLNAPRGTKLYHRMLRENRLAQLPTGDNTDCTMNFIPKMDAAKLLAGYEKVVETIYSQKYYCRRIKTFLKNYRPGDKTTNIFHGWDIRAFLKSVWHVGIVGKGRLHYWMLLLSTVRRPSHFCLAVRFSIYGHHFRTTFKAMQRHLIKLNKEASVASVKTT
ncbi:MAG: B12-binding domain-containing radical SAM protein [Planctomycetota bacterium]